MTEDQLMKASRDLLKGYESDGPFSADILIAGALNLALWMTKIEGNLETEEALAQVTSQLTQLPARLLPLSYILRSPGRTSKKRK